MIEAKVIRIGKDQLQMSNKDLPLRPLSPNKYTEMIKKFAMLATMAALFVACSSSTTETMENNAEEAANSAQEMMDQAAAEAEAAAAEAAAAAAAAVDTAAAAVEGAATEAVAH